MGVRFQVRHTEVQTSVKGYPPSYQIILDARLKRPKLVAIRENIHTATVFCKNNHTSYNKASYFLILFVTCVTWIASTTIETSLTLG
jgi:hypothetical protein